MANPLNSQSSEYDSLKQIPTYAFDAWLKNPEVSAERHKSNTPPPVTLYLVSRGVFRLIVSLLVKCLTLVGPAIYSLSSAVLEGRRSGSRASSYEFENWLKDPNCFDDRIKCSVGRSTGTIDNILNDCGEGNRTSRPVVLILYGTEYGFTQSVAERLSGELLKTLNRKLAAPDMNCDIERIIITRNMACCSSKDTAEKRHGLLGLLDARLCICFLLCSTQGDGVPPEGAREFHDLLSSISDPFSESPVFAELRHALSRVQFCVLALGDKNYPKFCQCGKDFELYLSRCGATMKLPRCDVDQEDEKVVSEWISDAVNVAVERFLSFSQSVDFTGLPDSLDSFDCAQPVLSAEDLQSLHGRHRNYPRVSKVLVKTSLCNLPSESGGFSPSLNSAEDWNDLDSTRSTRSGTSISSKQTISATCSFDNVALGLGLDLKAYVETKKVFHIEFDISDFRMNSSSETLEPETMYQPGDALGIWPANNDDEVKAILKCLDRSDDSVIILSDKMKQWVPASIIESLQLRSSSGGTADPKTAPNSLSLFNVLKYACDIRNISRSTLSILPSGSISEPSAQNFAGNSGLKIVDLLREFPIGSFDPQALVDTLKPLQPRLYSISSSPLVTPHSISITAALVHYLDAEQEYCQGVATGEFDRAVSVGTGMPIYIQDNTDFRLPEDFGIPLMLIGPGTGIAPFRSFLLHRRAQFVSRRIPFERMQCLVFYGCRNSDDFLYREKLVEWSEEGFITLFVAFSRMTKEKVYVQDLMRRNSKLVWSYIERGGRLYVCGDGTSMAKDVHKSLIDITMERSGVSESDAELFLKHLDDSGRYKRDIW